MKELIKRLEEASEGSRELDCQIALATGEFFIKHVEYKGGLYCKREDDGSISEPGNAPDMLVPHYTTSLDAALTLRRNGQDIMIDDDGKDEANVSVGACPDFPHAQVTTHGRNRLPRGIVAALLRAQEASNG